MSDAPPHVGGTPDPAAVPHVLGGAAVGLAAGGTPAEAPSETPEAAP
ncbi:hypothetical protein [Streptomyces hainanensis]|nr:hypothetical protein [Streptomyces hainanensis]